MTSRANFLLYVIGNSGTLTTLPHYRKLLKLCEASSPDSSVEFLIEF